MPTHTHEDKTMTAEITSIVILTEAVPKARPRFSFRTGTAYTPKKTSRFERLVRAYAHKAMAGRKPYGRNVAISLTMEFISVPPKSLSKTKQSSYANSKRPKTVKPDLDNLEKAICDGFNGVIYEDDANVWEVTARKRYGVMNRIEVTIKAEKLE